MKAVSAFDLEGPFLVTHSLHFCQVRTSRSLQCQYRSHDHNTGHMITIEAHMITIEAHMITRQSSHNVDIPDVLMVGGTSAECK